MFGDLTFVPNVVDAQGATISFSQQHRGRGDLLGCRTARGRFCQRKFEGNVLPMSSHQPTKRERTPRAILHMLSHLMRLTSCHSTSACPATVLHGSLLKIMRPSSRWSSTVGPPTCDTSPEHTVLMLVIFERVNVDSKISICCVNTKVFMCNFSVGCSDAIG